MGRHVIRSNSLLNVYLDFYAFIFRDGSNNQQQAVSEVRQTHDESGHVYEVLSLQSGGP